MDRLGSSKTAIQTDICDYSAPEQARGEVSPASNLYSLGMIMMHLLTNIAPCDMPNDGFQIQFSRYLVVIRSHSLAKVFNRILVLDPEQRLKFAEDALRDLNGYKKSEHYDISQGIRPKHERTIRDVVSDIAGGVIMLCGLITILVGLVYMAGDIYVSISGKRIHLSGETFEMLFKAGVVLVIILVVAMFVKIIADRRK